jgi:hypothetical protein
MNKRRLSLGAASLVLGLAAAVAVPTAAFATPTSPDGISDWRLCNGSAFQVWHNPFQVTDFNPRSAKYVTGGVQRSWEEETWTLGVFTSGYNFTVFCAA